MFEKQFLIVLYHWSNWLSNTVLRNGKTKIIRQKKRTNCYKMTQLLHNTRTYLERMGSVAVSGPLLLTDADFTWPLLGLKVSPVLPNPLTTRLAQIKILVLGLVKRWCTERCALYCKQVLLGWAERIAFQLSWRRACNASNFNYLCKLLIYSDGLSMSFKIIRFQLVVKIIKLF